MNRNKLSGAAVGTLLLGLAAASAAFAAVEEIPVTTKSAAARMDFIAGQAALDCGDGAAGERALPGRSRRGSGLRVCDGSISATPRFRPRSSPRA